MDSSVLLNCSPYLEVCVVITLTRVLVFKKYELEYLGLMGYHICRLLSNGSEKTSDSMCI